VCAEFQLDYLHFANYSSDDQTSSIRGVGGDPVGEGISLSLSYPFDNWADSVLPGTDAAGIFQTDGSTIFDYCAIRYPASGWGQFRVVFFVFPFEAIGSAGGAPNNRAAIMHRVVSWLSLSAPTPTPTSPPDEPPSDPGDDTPPAPGTLRVSLNGMHFAPGDLLKAWVYVPYIPSEEKMDGYAVVQGPGIALSVVGGGVLVPGVEPIIKGARGIPSYEGLLLQRVIPETASRGSYCISLGTLPSGLEPRAKSALDIASATFQIE
jgi:hypothetical protein